MPLMEVDNMAIWWNIAGHVVEIVNIAVAGYLYSRLIKPFLVKRKCAVAVGIVYISVMLVMYFISYEMESMAAYAAGTFAAFAVMCFLDRRNVEQKLFLAIVMYLLRWISSSITVFPRYAMQRFLIDSSFFDERPLLLFGGFVAEEVFCSILYFLLMAFLIRVINKVYVCKKENMSRKELGLMLAVPMSVLLGYGVSRFFSNIYLSDMGQYIWMVHQEYEWIEALYQVLSYIAIIAAIVLYQNIKENHRKEKENTVLSGQIENMEKHISEVESLYRDLRGLRHDIGNHVVVLENLVRKNQQQEAVEYLERLKERFHQTEKEVKSGNPVTDVILTEKQKEAKKKGIAFVCDFHYPEKMKINAFDVSVIVNNAVGNAIEAAEKCDAPYVHIRSYRKKNAYMIEVSNNFTGKLVIDEESGLPESTKSAQGHGFGLVNIRKVAQQYFGDIDIQQEGDKFILSIMLMAE